MIVRAEQVASIRQARVRNFEDRVVRLLREEFPEQSAGLDDGTIRRGIATLSDWCRQYAIEDENSVTKYIYLSWLLGARFETLPGNEWIYGIVRNLSRPSWDRMDIILSGVEHHLNTESGALTLTE